MAGAKAQEWRLRGWALPHRLRSLAALVNPAGSSQSLNRCRNRRRQPSAHRWRSFWTRRRLVQRIMSIGNSRQRRQTGFGSLTLLTYQPGLALCMSPSSLTPFRAGLSAGVSAVRRIRGSCLMRWSRLCMTGGPCIAAAWSITATGAASMSR